MNNCIILSKILHLTFLLALLLISHDATKAQAIKSNNSQNEIQNLLQKSTKIKKKKRPSFLLQRALENNEDDDFAYNLSPYAVKFTKCQYVKMYDDNRAQNKYISTVFSLKQFVIFRLCGTENCKYCDKNYGEYLVDVQDYLDNVVERTREEFENICEACDKDCGRNNNNDNENNNNNANNAAQNVDCHKCWQCDKVNELEENGYVDASTLTTCQKIQFGDDDDGGGNAISLYVGPRCYNSGKMIKIDVFSDYQCTTPYRVNVEDVLGYKLHYYILQRAFLSNSCTSSCVENNNRDGENGNGAGEVLEFCSNLYNSAAKCESRSGFKNGLASVSSDSSELNSEYDVCTFIDSLVWNSYDQKGEIAVGEPQDAIERNLTSMQRVVMSLLACITLTFVIYANYLQKKIKRYREAYDQQLLSGYQTSPSNAQF